MPTSHGGAETVPELVYRLAQAELARDGLALDGLVQWPQSDLLAELLFSAPVPLSLAEVIHPSAAAQTTDIPLELSHPLSEPTPGPGDGAISAAWQPAPGTPAGGSLIPWQQGANATDSMPRGEVPFGDRTPPRAVSGPARPLVPVKPAVGRWELPVREPPRGRDHWQLADWRSAAAAPSADLGLAPAHPVDSAAPDSTTAAEILRDVPAETLTDHNRPHDRSVRELALAQSEVLAAIQERLDEHERLWLEQQALRRAGH